MEILKEEENIFYDLLNPNQRDIFESEYLKLQRDADYHESINFKYKNSLGFRAYCPFKFDKKTQLAAEKKGGSCFLVSTKNDELVILLGKERNGKYQNTYNLFGGHFEEDVDSDCSHTAKREFGEEFNPKYIYDEKLSNWIKWCGSPWAFNTTHIEFGFIRDNFDADKAFRYNEEMSNAKWFPLKNFIIFSSKKTSNKFIIKDIDNAEREVSCYAHGVVNAAYNNKHFRI